VEFVYDVTFEAFPGDVLGQVEFGKTAVVAGSRHSEGKSSGFDSARLSSVAEAAELGPLVFNDESFRARTVMPYARMALECGAKTKLNPGIL
jgi:hypothetical protein